MDERSVRLKLLSKYLDGLTLPCLKQDILRHVEAVGVRPDHLAAFQALADTIVYHSREQILRVLAGVLVDQAPRT